MTIRAAAPIIAGSRKGRKGQQRGQTVFALFAPTIMQRKLIHAKIAKAFANFSANLCELRVKAMVGLALTRDVKTVT